jgi:UDP-N-acetylglucosamine pyrophosphorylase
MFKVNALLSKADKDGNTLDSLESLMFDLSYNNNALEQAKNLYNQALSQLIQERAELIKQKIKPPHQEPVVEVENIPNEEEE